jgi:Zn-dependent M28 family amino/carboxypeptidase
MQSPPTSGEAVETQPAINVPTNISAPERFSGDRAYKDVEYQVSIGPRIPGSEGNIQVGEWIRSELTDSGWHTEIQETEISGQPIRNIIGKWGQGEPWLVLGAHYDTRLAADRDPDSANHNKPVPGANDGGSGVSVLLELARILPAYQDSLRFGQIWLVFFDAEDNGDLPSSVDTELIPSRGWILGSRAFVDSLTEYPDAAVIVDMIGDVDLNIYMEKNSNLQITNEIWAAANALGYSKQFIPGYKWSMTDDHTPFLMAGIPAIDIIDFDYPYWHTVEDTPDKVSAASLKAVGDTLLQWLTTKIP